MLHSRVRQQCGREFLVETAAFDVTYQMNFLSPGTFVLAVLFSEVTTLTCGAFNLSPSNFCFTDQELEPIVVVMKIV